MRFKSASLIPATLLVILAGCSAGPETAPNTWLKGGDAAKPAGQTAAPLGGGTAASTTAGANVGTKTGGTAVSTSIDITTGGEQPIGTGTVLTPVKPAVGSPMTISAASGGLYMSADGSVKAQIPPGALSQDAVVRIQRRDTAGQKVTEHFVPGIEFDVDLGGASLRSDSQLLVAAKLDARFVEEMKRRDPAFSAEKYNLSQDAQGAWFMQMAVAGPTTRPVIKPAAPGVDAMMLLEFGTMPMPGAPSSAQRSLLGLSSSEDCTEWTSTIGIPVPTSMTEWRKLENQGRFSCSVYDGIDWYMNVFHDLTSGTPVCASSATPGASPAPIPQLQVVDVPAHVKFISDDPAVNGQDASNATVKYDFTWSPSNGPTDVVTNAAGDAKSHTLAGLDLSLTAGLDLGPVRGETVEAKAAAGMAPVQLTVGKYSPKIVVDITSESNLGPDIKVYYMLDGTAGETSFKVAADARVAHSEFYVIVPDDKTHDFTITGVDAAPETGIQAAPEPKKVQRNGVYGFALKMVNIAPH